MNRPRAAYEMYCIVRGDGQIINTMHYKYAADDIAKTFREAGGEYNVYPCLVIVTGTEWKQDADNIELNGAAIVMPRKRYARRNNGDMMPKKRPVHDMIAQAIKDNPDKTVKELAHMLDRHITQVYAVARSLKIKLPRKSFNAE